VSAFGGSLETGGLFCVGAFARNLASVALKMCSHLICFVKKLYMHFSAAFNAICKDNPVVSCNAIHCKKDSFWLILTDHTLG
jgi:hypothetical protein